MRSRSIKIFGGVDLGDDEGWETIIASVEAVLGALRAKDLAVDP